MIVGLSSLLLFRHQPQRDAERCTYRLNCGDNKTFDWILIVQRMIGDRLDIVGSRWGTEGAEAILKLRALIVNGDYPDVLVMPTVRA